MKRPLVILVSCVLVGLFAWKVYDKATQGKVEHRRGGGAVAVEVKPVETRSVRAVRTFTGSLRAASEFVLAPKIGGLLSSSLVTLILVPVVYSIFERKHVDVSSDSAPRESQPEAAETP